MELNMNLDDLQIELEKTLELLKDRQTGLMTWNMFLADRLKSIKQMIESAGIKE